MKCPYRVNEKAFVRMGQLITIRSLQSVTENYALISMLTI